MRAGSPYAQRYTPLTSILPRLKSSICGRYLDDRGDRIDEHLEPAWAESQFEWCPSGETRFRGGRGTWQRRDLGIVPRGGTSATWPSQRFVYLEGALSQGAIDMYNYTIFDALCKESTT